MTVRRRRILLIKPVLPYPPNQGTRVASFGLIKALQSAHDVTVLARILHPDEMRDVRELEKWCDRVVPVMAPNRKSLAHRIVYKAFYWAKSTVLRRSLKSLYSCPGVFRRAAAELARENFDFVIIEYWQLYPLFNLFPRDRRVLFTHDIDLLVNRDISLLERNLFRKIRAIRRWLVERKEELAAYRSAGRVWALTDRDRVAIQRICFERCSVEVVPFGMDVEHLSPPGMERNRGEVLFMGHLAAPFNRDALEHFVTKVYPHMDDIEPLSITIVGGMLPKEVEHFGLLKEVEVVGHVEDIRPYLHRASCIVVPLRFGGGLRIRILEAMAAGLPVVCSPVAIAGIPFEPEEDFLMGKDPEEMAAQIRRLLSDPELAASIADHARGKVLEIYSEERQRQRVLAMIDEAVQTPENSHDRP